MNEEIILQRMKEFTWYSPVDFGNSLVAKGDFLVDTAPESIHFGLGKWKYIVERNIPDLQGKRAMDIGCNNGVFCIQMARMGAREVIGIDSEKTWPRWKEQAEFVKEALEWRCRTRYPIRYVDADMADIPRVNLGHVDVVTALCCLYYLEDDAILSLLRHFREHAETVLIQCNTRREDQLEAVHRRAGIRYMVGALKRAGFPHVNVDAPWFYERPVVAGSIHPLECRTPDGKLDRLRHWVRRKI